MDNSVICVVGPTACGKTKMGVALAQRFGGEVVFPRIESVLAVTLPPQREEG